MIVDAILLLGIWVATLLVSLFPSSEGLPPEVLDAASSLGGYIGLLDSLVPVATIATTAGIAISVELAVFGWKTLKSLVSHIPLIGGQR
jgi:hypothetical protein